MHPVRIKTVGQQDIQAVHRVRNEIKNHRIAKGNQIRGLVAEYGLVAPQQLSALRKAIPVWLETADNGLTFLFRELLQGLREDLSVLDRRMAELDQQTCPVCGVTFYEFRSQGRLGCPHDYACFQAQLESLILNIHGETQHSGKSPKRCPDGGSERTQLIRLRREMKEAVEEEKQAIGARVEELRKSILQLSLE